MPFDTALGLFVALVILIYALAALIRPEKF
jgi:hypothetical protein